MGGQLEDVHGVATLPGDVWQDALRTAREAAAGELRRSKADMRIALWQISASLFAIAAFGVGYGLMAIVALLLADIVIQCVD